MLHLMGFSLSALKNVLDLKAVEDQERLSDNTLATHYGSVIKITLLLKILDRDVDMFTQQ